MTRTAATSATCPSCARPTVQLELAGDLVLRSCSPCDRRTWLRGGEPVGRRQALSVVAVTSGRRAAAA